VDSARQPEPTRARAERPELLPLPRGLTPVFRSSGAVRTLRVRDGGLDALRGALHDWLDCVPRLSISLSLSRSAPSPGPWSRDATNIPTVGAPMSAEGRRAAIFAVSPDAAGIRGWFVRISRRRYGLAPGIMRVLLTDLPVGILASLL
jgi:hypothetical protein